MKNKFLLTFILLSFGLLMYGQVVTPDQARIKAISFFRDVDNQNNSLKSGSIAVVDLFRTFTVGSAPFLKSASVQNEPAFYIFNRSDKPGFVIISAEDKISDIIAWSDQSGMCEVNPSQKLLFDQYMKEIAVAKTLNVSSPAAVNSTQEVLEPLLRKIEWNQSPAPYNSFCPVDPATGRTCPVGCVATALAQVIYYYKYPRFGTGSISYSSNFGVLSANFAGAEYNYEAMSDQPPVGVLNPDIAELCYHAGLSLETDYGPYESSAYEGSVATALFKYFKYKQPSFRYQSNFTFDAWKSLIIKEINNSRPIIYGALDPLDPNIPDDVAGGHAFILDGYTNEDQFHINWGWGGCSNGFYRLNLLTPSDCGDIYTFSDLHNMITGIEPATTFECLLTANKDSLQFEVSGGQRTLNISSNTNWKVLEYEPWITVSSTTGTGNKAITITTQSNEGFLDRSAEVKLSGCDEDRIILVSQKGTCSLSMSTDSLNFTVLQSAKKIGIVSTSSWMATTSASWISVYPGVGDGKDSLSVSVSDNMGYSQRSGTVKIYGCNSFKTIKIYQKGTCSLSLSASNLAISSDSTKQTISVTSGTSTSWSVTSDVDWATVSPSSFIGNGSFTISVKGNITDIKRTGTISVKGCNEDRTVEIVQNGVCFIDLAALNVEFDPDAEYKFIKVFSNSPWTAVTETCWITVTPTHGNDNDYLKIEVLPNTGQSARSGTIDVSGCGFTRKISVIQQSYCPLDVTTSLLDFTYYTGTKSAAIISTGVWAVTADAPWISFTPSNGSKLGNITVSVPANTSAVKRTGNLTIAGCYTTKNISITQGFCSFTVSDQKLVVPFGTGQKVINIKSTSAWTASADSRWVAVTPTFGTEDGNITLLVDANPLTRRKAVITITSCFGYKELEITQEGNPTPITSILDSEFRVYPTPTDRFVKIEFPSGTTDCSLDVFTETGQKVLSKNRISSGDEMDLNGMASGVYYFKIQNARFTDTRKIVLR
jgi:hypothetical protein